MIHIEDREATLPTEVDVVAKKFAEVPLIAGRRDSVTLTVGAKYGAKPMNTEDAKKHAIDLYRLAFLLTGRADISIDIAADTAAEKAHASSLFPAGMEASSRRIVTSKALAAIRDELAESARQTELAHVRRLEAPPRAWSLSPGTSKAQIEEALLTMDVFPRAAVLLSLFESVPIAEVATLLDADAGLVRKGQALGLRQLIGNLARKMNYSVLGIPSFLKIALAAE